MRRTCIVVAISVLFFIGCATPKPYVTMGADAVLSADGLHGVMGISTGTLFLKPNYAFGTYHAFALSPTVVTFKQGSRVLEDAEVTDLKAAFEGVARAAIGGTGRNDAGEPAACVAMIQLGLVDLELLDPKKVGPAGPDGLRTVGAATLVFEIRDGHTSEPLLRYGQRQRLAGRSRDVRGEALVDIFERFAIEFQKDFERSVSSVEEGEPPLSCVERAAQS